LHHFRVVKSFNSTLTTFLPDLIQGIGKKRGTKTDETVTIIISLKLTECSHPRTVLIEGKPGIAKSPLFVIKLPTIGPPSHMKK